jgi:hypothetical protein
MALLDVPTFGLEVSADQLLIKSWRRGGGAEQMPQLSASDLTEASAVFDPKIEKLLASAG